MLGASCVIGRYNAGRKTPLLAISRERFSILVAWWGNWKEKSLNCCKSWICRSVDLYLFISHSSLGIKFISFLSLLKIDSYICCVVHLFLTLSAASHQLFYIIFSLSIPIGCVWRGLIFIHLYCISAYAHNLNYWIWNWIKQWGKNQWFYINGWDLCTLEPDLCYGFVLWKKSIGKQWHPLYHKLDLHYGFAFAIQVCFNRFLFACL